MGDQAKNKTKSKNVEKSAARLLAVQALYAMISEEKDSVAVIPDYLAHYAGMELDDEKLVTPDEALFRDVVEGVESHFSDLDAEIQETSARPITKSKDPLLLSILICGLYEVKNNYHTDIPIIISDYLNVTHAFFEQNEAKLVNALLDRAAKKITGKLI